MWEGTGSGNCMNGWIVWWVIEVILPEPEKVYEELDIPIWGLGGSCFGSRSSWSRGL